MENRANAMEANRRIVQEGLARRRREHQLDAFETAMIQRCNEHYYHADLQRKMDDTTRIGRELCAARIVARAERRAVGKRIRKDTALGCLSFFAASVVTMWLTTWTNLPVWAAVTFIVSMALFLAAYICDLHGFLSMEVKK